MSEWQDISTAPKDGIWFMICHAEDGFDSYEIGKYAPLYYTRYEETEEGSGLYRVVQEPCFDWHGFNNMHRATHWMPLQQPPVTT